MSVFPIPCAKCNQFSGKFVYCTECNQRFHRDCFERHTCEAMIEEEKEKQAWLE